MIAGFGNAPFGTAAFGTPSVFAAATGRGVITAAVASTYTLPVGVAPASPALWIQAITRGGMTTVIYVDVYDGNVRVGRLYPKTGSVTADFVTGVRRTLNATFTPDAAPLLAPGLELRPFSGFHYGIGAPEVLPLGAFPITASSLGIRPDAECTVTCQDRYQWIVASTFLTPYSTTPTLPIRDHLTRLVRDTGMWSDATIVNTISSAAKPGVQSWDADRSQAIGDLCKSVGAEAFVSRDGRMILRDRRAATSTPKLTLAGGNGGRLIDAVFTVDTTVVYNVVTVVSSITDPAFIIPPVTVRILDPTHPAYPRPGKVLTRPYRVDSALYTTTAQAKAAAQKMLTRLSAVGESGTVVAMPDASLDESDTIAVVLGNGTTKVAQVQQITYPLTVADEQNITTVSTRSDEDFNP